MMCPNCGGKTRVADRVDNTWDDEIYRERVCTECHHIFYTAEIEVEKNEQFKEKWYKYHRDRKKYSTHRGRYFKEKGND